MLEGVKLLNEIVSFMCSNLTDMKHNRKSLIRINR